MTWQGELPKTSQASYTPEGPEAIHDLSRSLNFQQHSGCGVGKDAAQRVPPAVRVLVLRCPARETQAAGSSSEVRHSHC